MKRYLHTMAALWVLFLLFSIHGLAQENNNLLLAESIEDFETGDFSKYDWQFEGSVDWLVIDVNPYEGTYAAQSGYITHSQTSAIYLEYTVYAPDILSFWYKTSTEANYDYLNFYIDGNLVDSWAGEIPWTYTEYSVAAGNHTFKWEYSKDFSVSTGLDAVWVDLITFPPEEIQALFSADTNVICQGDFVNFTDLSVGPITEWYWVFEGAVPLTSTEQNPVVQYPSVGDWDVFLEVTDGIETANFYMPLYIGVSATPEIANTPVGISSLCASWGNTTYTTTSLGGDVTSYNWVLDPPEAGTISGNGGTNITVIWEPDFLGTVDLMVGGINYCGVGTYSIPLTITRYLPDVSLVLPAYVALPEPPFELTGGMPLGGEYSGPGVSNGWFDPAAAGMGAHTITYTYTDANMCSNSATDVITVTEFIGIDEKALGSEVSLYPNPSSGSFSLQLNVPDKNLYDVKVFNAVNEIVFSESQVNLGNGLQKKFVLDLTNGIYFVKITGKEKEYIRKLVLQD